MLFATGIPMANDLSCGRYLLQVKAIVKQAGSNEIVMGNVANLISKYLPQKVREKSPKINKKI